ncbi:MAG: hypothetical protein R8K46_08410 [Mariprofundaceae bacterium]
MLVQQTVDAFIRHEHARSSDTVAGVEACFAAFGDYLVHFSDLYHDAYEDGDMEMEEWEETLNASMERLLGEDVDSMTDLGALPLSDLDAEQLRDFFGWYLLREQGADAATIEVNCAVMQRWFDFLVEKRWIKGDVYMEFATTLQEMAVDAIRAAKASHLLFHYVRLGAGVAPRLKGQRFTGFREGHARIVQLKDQQMMLQFDGGDPLGPVPVATGITSLLTEGDVLDVELGLRGDTWIIVDVGPVYPSSVYVDSEEFPPQALAT